MIFVLQITIIVYNIKQLLYRFLVSRKIIDGMIEAAYDKALRDTDFQTMKDCVIVVKYLLDPQVYVVEGEERNMKMNYVCGYRTAKMEDQYVK